MSECGRNPLENISDEQLNQLLILLEDHHARIDGIHGTTTRFSDALFSLLDAVEESYDTGEPLPIREFDPKARDHLDLQDELSDLTARKDNVRRLLAEDRASVGAHGQLKRLYRDIRDTRAAIAEAEADLLERNVRRVFGMPDDDEYPFDYDDFPYGYWEVYDGLTQTEDNP